MSQPDNDPQNETTAAALDPDGDPQNLTAKAPRQEDQAEGEDDPAETGGGAAGS